MKDNEDPSQDGGLKRAQGPKEIEIYKLCHWLEEENEARGGTEKCPCPDDHMDERMPLIKICHKKEEPV